MNIDSFSKARNRFYDAKSNYVAALNEFRDARNDYDKAISTWNSTIEQEKEMISNAHIFSSPQFNAPEIRSPLKLGEISYTENSHGVAEKRVGNEIEILPRPAIRPAASYINRNVERFSAEINDQERKIWYKEIKPFVENKGLPFIADKTGIKISTMQQWFKRDSCPAREGFDKLQNYIKSLPHS